MCKVLKETSETQRVLKYRAKLILVGNDISSELEQRPRKRRARPLRAARGPPAPWVGEPASLPTRLTPPAALGPTPNSSALRRPPVPLAHAGFREKVCRPVSPKSSSKSFGIYSPGESHTGVGVSRVERSCPPNVLQMMFPP